MSATFVVLGALTPLVMAFVTIAALVTALRCAKRPSTATGTWVLFAGVALGLLVTCSHGAMNMAMEQVFGSSSLELRLTMSAALSLVNVVSTALMVAGMAMVRPEPASAAAKPGQP